MLQKALTERLKSVEKQGQFRSFPGPITGVDFCSNDYLGLACNPSLHRQIRQNLDQQRAALSGPTGSRLISGDGELVAESEQYIAAQHRVDSALLLPSGYMANLALFSALPERKDTVILDEYMHRSAIDGVQLSGARRWKFRHNDMGHLEELLKRNKGRSWIGVESLYSMDGDVAPLKDLLWLSERYQAGLIVDEAHAVGVFGLGFVKHFGLQKRVFATLVTYGKAMGQSGAAILGSDHLIQWLINRASPVMYSTAVSPYQSISIRTAYEFLDGHPKLKTGLEENIQHFRALVTVPNADKHSPIQPVFLSPGCCVDTLMSTLVRHGLQTYFVRSPSVPKGKERIRVCLHQHNSKKQIALLAELINLHR